MRVPIAWEGKVTVDARVIEPGGITWESEPLPLMLSRNGSGHDGQSVIGTVTEIERVVIVEGRLNRIDAVLSHAPVGMACEPDFDVAEIERGPWELAVLKTARLRAVTLGLRPAWPDLTIEAPHA